jgi:hypothetical protein
MNEQSGVLAATALFISWIVETALYACLVKMAPVFFPRKANKFCFSAKIKFSGLIVASTKIRHIGHRQPKYTFR